MLSEQESANKALATIGLTINLSEMFPNKLLAEWSSNTPRYDNLIALMLEALHAAGVSNEMLLDYLIQFVTGGFKPFKKEKDKNSTSDKTDDKKKTWKTLDDVKKEIAEKQEKIYTETGELYDWAERFGISGADEVVSEWEDNRGIVGALSTIEKGVKPLIEIALAALYSCSANPIIPDYAFNDNGIEIPLDSIDLGGFLKISPLSQEGKYRYAYPEDGFDSLDFNTFLWFVINQGEDNTFYPWVRYIDGEEESGTTICEVKYREVQNSITVRFNKERYYRAREINPLNTEKPTYFNKTLYEFNHDYMKSQILYTTPIVIGGILDIYLRALRGGILPNISVHDELILGTISEAIKTAMSTETEIDDDFFLFDSGKEYDKMLQETELAYMNGVPIYNGASDVVDIANSNLENNLNDLYSNTATLQEYQSKLKETIYDVAATPSVTEAEKDLKIDFRYPEYIREDWINTLIFDLTRTLVQAVASPKIMLLIAINYNLMGYTKPTIDNIVKVLLKIITRITAFVVNEIVKKLLELFKTKIGSILPKINWLLLYEQITKYEELLESMLATVAFCKIPLGGINGFFPKRKSAPSNIDNVNYADILPLKK